MLDMHIASPDGGPPDHCVPEGCAALVALTVFAYSRTMSPRHMPNRFVIEPSDCPTGAARARSP